MKNDEGMGAELCKQKGPVSAVSTPSAGGAAPRLCLAGGAGGSTRERSRAGPRGVTGQAVPCHRHGKTRREERIGSRAGKTGLALRG